MPPFKWYLFSECATTGIKTYRSPNYILLEKIVFPDGKEEIVSRIKK